MNATKLCSIDGCGKPIKARGWCETHYARWKRHGDPLTTQRFMTPEESFSAKTSWQNDCLIWLGGNNKKGYGHMRVNGIMMRVHRYAWQRAHGEIPDDKVVDHICHNPSCVNVEHLRLATYSENSSNRSGPDDVSSKSGLRNVYKSGAGWMVRIGKNGERYYFGTYINLERAKQVAREARHQLFGEYAGRG